MCFSSVVKSEINLPFHYGEPEESYILGSTQNEDKNTGGTGDADATRDTVKSLMRV